MALAFVAVMHSWGLSHKLQIATAINFNYDLLLLPYLPREQKLIVYKQKADIIQYNIFEDFISTYRHLGQTLFKLSMFHDWIHGMSAKVHC